MALVDNNVLSSLAKIDRLELLPSVFETVETPPSVIGELDRAEVDGYEFVTRIDGSCEQPVASSFVQHSVADAVELAVDRVHVKSTKMVQQCPRQRIP